MILLQVLKHYDPVYKVAADGCIDNSLHFMHLANAPLVADPQKYAYVFSCILLYFGCIQVDGCEKRGRLLKNLSTLGDQWPLNAVHPRVEA